MDVVDKPWGGYITFAKNEKVTVKILRIDRGEETSLQSHRNRDEEWFLLKGKVRIQYGHYVDKLNLKVMQKGEVMQIPRGLLHRTSGIDDSAILEISRGEFDEEDIVRYEDKYGRAEKRGERQWL